LPKPWIKEIIVVEGRNDTVAIRRAVDADTIETRGSAIPRHVLQEIRRAQAKRGVIIFTDPDHAGERIRRLISHQVDGVKHAFLAQHQAKGKRKVGVEHALPEMIQQALTEVRT
jgi:ribonuclease M5